MPIFIVHCSQKQWNKLFIFQDFTSLQTKYSSLKGLPLCQLQFFIKMKNLWHVLHHLVAWKLLLSTKKKKPQVFYYPSGLYCPTNLFRSTCLFNIDITVKKIYVDMVLFENNSLLTKVQILSAFILFTQWKHAELLKYRSNLQQREVTENTLMYICLYLC